MMISRQVQSGIGWMDGWWYYYTGLAFFFFSSHLAWGIAGVEFLFGWYTERVYRLSPSMREVWVMDLGVLPVQSMTPVLKSTERLSHHPYQPVAMVYSVQTVVLIIRYYRVLFVFLVFALSLQYQSGHFVT
ncbi:hypothetical protein L873DRAFT_1474260 [Choiromyces venosus 120613-1]|uniref:Uncharacterized protein n=1 Tax=Choiromyces venosus 120613-1 TaxID=1336337 RepID=A0A3N4JJV2_9PEZI|nr:hypothetical protein L873DRAFT_1474260 [Choiromyces venosus 120613-1]